jgi:hypothetical protein
MSKAAFLAVAVIIALACWWQYSLWSECRITNSFFYCLRILSSR